MTSGPAWPATAGELILWCEARLAAAGVFCGHGTASFRDEAAALVFHVMDLDHDDAVAGYRATVSQSHYERLTRLLRRRIDERVPTPYLTGEAWFAGLRFAIDRRALIPRSPFAELIGARFEPWVRSTQVRRILEIGTGSGCIAVACALAFPAADVVASDISREALDLARVNVEAYGLGHRVRLVEADLFDGIDGRFELIISNPPYVPEIERESLPAEYHHEPALALFSGADGLESAGRILQDAPRHLARNGLLALEVGSGRARLDAGFPRLPFLWPDLASGGEGIALLRASDWNLAGV